MSDDDCPDLIPAKVPVAILTGFLGSGKTTLLQHVMTQQHGLKIAVIVNEFEFGRTIEKGLTVQSSEKSEDEWLELNNGCLCCTAKTQTVLALESLIARQGSLDLILIETSGLADPAPVAQMFWQDDALQSALRLAGVLTVVDCVNIRTYLEGKDTQEAQQQLLVADKIVFNKVDLLEDGARSVVEAAVRAVNPAAEAVFTSFSRIDDLGALLRMDTTDEDAAAYIAAKADDVRVSQAAAISAGGRHGGVTAVHVEVRGSVLPTRQSADALFGALLYTESEEAAAAGDGGDDGVSRQPGKMRFDIVRSKAAVWVGGQGTCSSDIGTSAPAAWQGQSIGDTFDVVPMADALGGGLPFLVSRFLFFGRGLDAAALEAVVTEAFVPVEGTAAGATSADIDWTSGGKRQRASA